MTIWQFVGLLGGGYLLLLARSAWVQGEMRQFLWSLLIVLTLVGVLAGVVALAVLLDGP